MGRIGEGWAHAPTYHDELITSLQEAHDFSRSPEDHKYRLRSVVADYGLRRPLALLF